jgi:hypothetical protein
MNIQKILDGMEESRIRYEESLAHWIKREFVELKKYQPSIKGKLAGK